jgi:hypothetical protein
MWRSLIRVLRAFCVLAPRRVAAVHRSVHDS